MCGIVGYVGKGQAAPVLLEGLAWLEYRGYDSAGIAVQDEPGAGIRVIKTQGRLKCLVEKAQEGRLAPGCCGIGHTRWATHGEPSARNAHPHASPQNRVVLVHNGIIENSRELRSGLEGHGYVFHSETDTEAAALLLHECYQRREEKEPHVRALEAIYAMLQSIEGSFALGMLFADLPGVIYAARRGSPLIVGRCEGETEGHILASDVPAMLPFTRDVIYMDDLEIAVLEKDRVRFYDRNLQPVTKTTEHIAWNAQAAEKGGYAHYMLKEMMEQSEAVENTLTPRLKMTQGGMQVDLSETGMTQEALDGVKRVLFAGCGSAYHAGRIGQWAVEKIAKIPCDCELASELSEREMLLSPGTLCVVISQSGETADSLSALRLCRTKGVKTLAIVNVVASSIAREADAVLYTHAGPEIAVATTKAYSAQLAALYLLALRLAQGKGTLSSKQRENLLRELRALPGKINEALSCRTQMERLAKRLCDCKGVFFIGRGPDLSLCMEGSLKLKEISYIPCEAYAAGELKHGTISLIEDGVLLIGVSTQRETAKKMNHAMEEARARGAHVIALTLQGEDMPAADETVVLPQVHPLFAASVAVVPLQLLSYAAACQRGLDVDKPRNLAKSVTVE